MDPTDAMRKHFEPDGAPRRFGLPPPVLVGTDAPHGAYAIAGFAEFERWMLLHEPIYRAAAAWCAQLRVSEIDRLRLLLAMMGEQLAAIKAQAAVDVAQAAGGLQKKVQQVVQLTHTGVPLRVEDWTEADWCDLNAAMSQAIAKIAARHRA